MANPGRDGSVRYRFTHKGLVYVTDSTMRHEITSWRLDGAEGPALSENAGSGTSGSHTVIVVDNSGSMRKCDVHGYSSRTAAVYDCLARDFMDPLLGGAAAAEDCVVTLIAMGDSAKVVFKLRRVDADLSEFLRAQGREVQARGHGNYLPALKMAQELLAADAGHGKQLFLLVLSDGAPSDHISMECDHGCRVWEEDTDALGRVQQVNIGGRMKAKLKNCNSFQSNTCRKQLHERVKRECRSSIITLGDMFGRDRMYVGTVAFGSPNEDYSVLEGMAGVLPKSSFQKLGLSALHLRTAFSSLTSSLTTLLTDGGVQTGSPLTLRKFQMEDKGVRGTDGWHMYKCPSEIPGVPRLVPNMSLLSKCSWSLQANKLTDVPIAAPASGVAMSSRAFAHGAERLCFYCSEIDSGTKMVGPKLVAKETLHKEHQNVSDFHARFCKLQAEAHALAQLFNRRLSEGEEHQVNFVPCWVYSVKDDAYDNGRAEILAEPELEGKFTKWNNNNGSVKAPASKQQVDPLTSRLLELGAIVEDDEDDEGSDEGGEEDAAAIEDVPQCFSHFTYVATEGKKLVCDIQGVWNAVDGFVLTDPVIHFVSASSKKGTNGKTDKGAEGVQRFFSTHKCGALCRRLGLPPYSSSNSQRFTMPGFPF